LPAGLADVLKAEGYRFGEADTTTPHGRLMLTVLGGIAEFERDLILERTNEGRARAVADGVRFGRKPKLTKHQAREALQRLADGESTREVALSYAVDQSTISRLKARYVRLRGWGGLQVQIGPANPIATVLIALMFAAWLVAIWVMLRMMLAAFKKRGSLWLFGSSMPLASYNRNASRLFAASILFVIAVAILLFALIPRNRVGAPPRASATTPPAGSTESGQAKADMIPATPLPI
jgi:hypothetical protein